ncbi:hypothetical protein M422DRAFT_259754 [Sphaerobolus stellatus SS14]|uniref:Uncharacterized protein n=1 Tax=Sphaerobolus stellatus (strain SS14) TaxID=990650 RepID=A0A0C9VJ71_SPHS4|nr:hypothetical protein M422DRAFT_259754 [Sphaerobolus stellatus SS14]
MSFTQIWGNFLLKTSYRKNPFDDQLSDIGFHLHYESQLLMTNGEITVDIRIYQSIADQALLNGSIAFVFRKFHMVKPTKMEIEAVHIFRYHHSITSTILQAFTPRVSIPGYITQETELLKDGTKLIFINAMGHVREYQQVITRINGCQHQVASSHEITNTANTEIHSPVHITGFIDCLDEFSLIPVITIEELTLEVGNNRVAELINQARLDSIRSNIGRDPASQQTFQTHIEFNDMWRFQPSTASLSSVPAYNTPYPRPFPLDGVPYWLPRPADVEYLPPRYPAPSECGDHVVEKNPTRKQESDMAKIPAHLRAISIESECPFFPTQVVREGSVSTISDDEARPNKTELSQRANDQILRHHDTYLEDLLQPGERDFPSSKKRKTPQTPSIMPHRPRKRARSLSPSQNNAPFNGATMTTAAPASTSFVQHKNHSEPITLQTVSRKQNSSSTPTADFRTNGQLNPLTSVNILHTSTSSPVFDYSVNEPNTDIPALSMNNSVQSNFNYNGMDIDHATNSVMARNNEAVQTLHSRFCNR